jgi:hypothetical protein
MKKRIIFCFLFLVFIITHGNAEQTRPVAVSPGSESGMVVVGQSCPTFSWSAVQWTEAYRVVVFQAVGDEAMSYEKMEAISNPMISKEIRGPALSWTPSEEERLINGGVYVWYVQAVDTSGVGIWSEGRMFQVEEAVRLVGVEEKLRESLKQYGMSDEDIDRVLSDVTAGIKEVDVQGGGLMLPGIVRTQGMEDTYNTFYGLNAGAVTTGNYNTFLGYAAGYSNTDGSRNTYLGHAAGYFNIDGEYNTFIGYRAGYKNITGYRNTFIGYRAGYKNTIGNKNLFLGYQAGNSNTEGNYNTFLGYKAGYSNTTGSNNTFIGHYAGNLNTTGSNNTFIGIRAGNSNASGNWNTFLGEGAGYANTTGDGNTFIGIRAGYNNTGISNVFLGNNAGYNESGSSRLYIANSSTSTPLIYGQFDTNKVRINSYLGVGVTPTRRIDVTGGAYCDGTTWVDASSREYKENIESLDAEEAMDALEGLEPVKFKYKRNKGEESVGFIAEDVPELVATRDRKGMSAMDVVAVLTKVVQGQQMTISELKNRIAEIEKEKQEK